jgi:hypothetical protein
MPPENIYSFFISISLDNAKRAVYVGPPVEVRAYPRNARRESYRANRHTSSDKCAREGFPRIVKERSLNWGRPPRLLSCRYLMSKI